jgi:hypothetical protein
MYIARRSLLGLSGDETLNSIASRHFSPLLLSKQLD